MARRRSAGDGSLYYRADKGLWVAQHHGVYRYSRDKSKAKQKLLALLTQAEESKPNIITLGNYMGQWFEYSKPNFKPGTVKRYSEAIEVHIKPALGANTKLHTIEARAVEKMYADMLRDGLSPATVYIVHSVLSSAFKRAVKWQLVPHNIMHSVERPRIPHKEVEIFDPSEVRRILSEARRSPMEAAYILALSTGMRGGEIFALQPQDYDSGKLAIRRTLVNNGTQIGTPKSRNSRRTIQLPVIARDALERHLHNGGGNWMFPSNAGTNMRYSNVIRLHWRPLLQRAGVEYKTFHTCRHYVASTLISQNVPISAIARYLGDNEVTVLRTYSHLIDGMQDLAATAMDEALG